MVGAMRMALQVVAQGTRHLCSDGGGAAARRRRNGWALALQLALLANKLFSCADLSANKTYRLVTMVGAILVALQAAPQGARDLGSDVSAVAGGRRAEVALTGQGSGS